MNIIARNKIKLSIISFFLLFFIFPVYKAQALIETPVMLVSLAKNESVLLQWATVPEATNYLVEYKETNGTNWTTYPHPPSSTTAISISNLTNETSYDFRVSSIGVSEQSSPSEISSSTPSENATDNSNKQIISTGQSNALGAYSGQLISTTQTFSNRMLNSDRTSLIPLIEPIVGIYGGMGESMSSGLANSLSTIVPGYSSIISLSGISGAPYVNIMQGTPAYINALENISIAKNLSLEEGKTLTVPAITLIHGEGDDGIGTSAQQYEQYLLDWQSNYEDDIQSITGQTETIPLFTDQVSSWLTNWAPPQVALGQYQAAKNNGDKIILVTPKYIFDFVDSIHLTSYSQRRLGEYYAKVYKKVVVDGEQWRPLMPTNITISGNIINATFHVPVPPLTLDFSGVAFNTNFGFEYSDSTNSAFITSVVLTGEDSVQITLSTTPTGNNPRLRYAYTGNIAWTGGQYGGAGGNLRDSDMTPATHQDSFVPSYMGNYLHNWLVTFDEPVTVLQNTPDQPTSIVATPGPTNGTALIYFNPPNYTGNSPISNYVVFSSIGNIFASGTNSPIMISGLSNNTSYTFTVKALNSFGYSLPSSPSNSITLHWIEDATQVFGSVPKPQKPNKPENKSPKAAKTSTINYKKEHVTEKVSTKI